MTYEDQVPNSCLCGSLNQVARALNIDRGQIRSVSRFLCARQVDDRLDAD
jgi:hypothetical protein